MNGSQTEQTQMKPLYIIYCLCRYIQISFFLSTRIAPEAAKKKKKNCNSSSGKLLYQRWITLHREDQGTLCLYLRWGSLLAQVPQISDHRCPYTQANIFHHISSQAAFQSHNKGLQWDNQGRRDLVGFQRFPRQDGLLCVAFYFRMLTYMAG